MRIQSNTRLRQASSAALSTLLKIVVDPSAPASARVRAADRILERGNHGLEIKDLEVRLTALKQAAEMQKRRKCEP